MSQIKENLKYSKSHEWIRIEGDVAVCGVTDHAQEMMTDVVFVELPEVNDSVTLGDTIITIESVKAVSEVYAPLSGTIIEVNEILEEEPELINTNPYDGGWVVKIKMSQPNELNQLISAADYSAFVEE